MKGNQLEIHPSGLHVAIIMDGSGRWAVGRGKPRTEGHRAGVLAVRRAIEAAPGLGVSTLTLHAFSAQNWQRPEAEVGGLFRVIESFLRAETPGWVAAGVRVSVFGRRDRLPAGFLRAIEHAETATERQAATRLLHLRLAIDYSAREAILAAARRSSADATEEEFASALAVLGDAYKPLRDMPASIDDRTHRKSSDACAAGELEPESPDVDLLIRTGGELRLSDFMLWECAYAELYFTPRLWPDFGAGDLEAAIREYHSRERRFGRIPESVAV